MPSPKIRCKTVILSDIHLGTPEAKAAEATRFLKHIRCEKLVLNGDIIDAWQLQRNSAWLRSHTGFIREVLKMMQKRETQVVYLRGNHDDVLDRFVPIELAGLKIVNEYIHPTPRGNYLIVHGDGFDQVTTRYRWVARLGSVGYDFLLRFNHLYNKWRGWRGKGYYSLSKIIKAKVKGAVNFVGRYEEQLQELARTRQCVGIICGHIHTADDKQIGEIHYLNSGDWVESLTAIIEWRPGVFQLVSYEDFNALVGSDHTTSDKLGSKENANTADGVPEARAV